MRGWIGFLAVAAATAATAGEVRGPVRVAVPLVGSTEVDLSDLVSRLAGATGVDVARPPGGVTLPVTGVAGNLARAMLASCLGAEVAISVGAEALVLDVGPGLLAAARRAEWAGRVRSLAAEARREAGRRSRYGLHATASYRPGDPARPTVCLVHGVNSSSGGFVHMIRPLEEAGYGVVVYDYPYNRSLEESGARFARDWAEFRKARGETRAWAVVAHSMGALVARDYVEGPGYGGDVSTLILLAPVNRGSYLARTQTFLQLLRSTQAVNGRNTSDALAHLGDGLGQAAADMTPGSTYLRALNARPRRQGVAYHILAGDVGVLPAETRRQIEARYNAAASEAGLLGRLARMAAGGDDFLELLDELADGTGDGCVAVARTRLDGVADHAVAHANHAELIRAPVLFADPGPVVCMPYLLRWLDRPKHVD